MGLPRRPSPGRTVSLACLVAGVAAASGLLAGQGQAPAGADARGPVTIVVELIAEDAKGKSIDDLKLEELDVVQDATRQTVTHFAHHAQPGRYELRYVPRSGKAGGVTVSLRRRGAKLRGPAGPFLSPRVLTPLSPLEAELTGILETRPSASDLPCDAAVLHFDSTPRGLRHSFAVELPLAGLRLKTVGPLRPRGRLQILVRVRDEGGKAIRHLTLDRQVEAASGFAVDRLVWTGTLPLAPGRYTADVLVREPDTERVTVRALPVEVPAPRQGVTMSSVVLLRPTSLRVRTEGDDDPLVYKAASLMPDLRVRLPVGVDTSARFFVVLYPDPNDPAPPSLKLELLREGVAVGAAPVVLPDPEPSGEIRYVGSLQTRTFQAKPYTLRLVAQQGQTTASEEAGITVVPDAPVGPVRMAPRF